MRVPYRKPGKYSQMKPDFSVTEEKFLELRKELENLKRIQPQAAAEVSRLAELGDFSENAEYQLAKGRLRGINNAILNLTNRLDWAVVIKKQKHSDIAQLGSTVTIESSGKQISYQILGSSETNPQKGIISHNSPIGAALIGHKTGDVVKTVLSGNEVSYKIIKIE